MDIVLLDTNPGVMSADYCRPEIAGLWAPFSDLSHTYKIIFQVLIQVPETYALTSEAFHVLKIINTDVKRSPVGSNRILTFLPNCWQFVF